MRNLDPTLISVKQEGIIFVGQNYSKNDILLYNENPLMAMYTQLFLTNLASLVISAKVTMAPRGESANFAIRRPNFKLQRPTQFLVTVTARG